MIQTHHNNNLIITITPCQHYIKYVISIKLFILEKEIHILIQLQVELDMTRHLSNHRQVKI